MAANDIILIQQVASGAIERTFNPSTSAGYLPRFVATGIGQSIIYDTGTNVGVGTIDPSAKFTVSGVSSATTFRAASAVYDVDGELRTIPLNSQTSNYNLTVDDVGKFVNITTGGVNILASRFAAGDQFLIYNNSTSNQTLSGQSGTVIRLAGSATTGSRTIAQYGLCSVLCVSANIFVVAGTGVT